LCLGSRIQTPLPQPGGGFVIMKHLQLQSLPYVTVLDKFSGREIFDYQFFLLQCLTNRDSRLYHFLWPRFNVRFGAQADVSDRPR